MPYSLPISLLAFVLFALPAQASRLNYPGPQQHRSLSLTLEKLEKYEQNSSVYCQSDFQHLRHKARHLRISLRIFENALFFTRPYYEQLMNFVAKYQSCIYRHENHYDLADLAPIVTQIRYYYLPRSLHQYGFEFNFVAFTEHLQLLKQRITVQAYPEQLKKALECFVELSSPAHFRGRYLQLAGIFQALKIEFEKFAPQLQLAEIEELFTQYLNTEVPEIPFLCAYVIIGESV